MTAQAASIIKAANVSAATATAEFASKCGTANVRSANAVGNTMFGSAAFVMIFPAVC